MAYYSSVLQQLNSQLNRMYDEVERVKSQINNMIAPSLNLPAVNIPDANAITAEVIRSVSRDVDTKLDCVKADAEKARGTLETVITAKLEQYISRLVKDRVDLAMQNIRTQVLNDIDLRIEEMKEDIMGSIMTTSQAANYLTPSDVMSPPTQPTQTSQTSQPPQTSQTTQPPSQLPSQSLPPPTMLQSTDTMIDIDALASITKDILNNTDNAAGSDGDAISEINFTTGPKKKTLRKNKH